ncbi:MAG: hypothetical protein PVF95_03895, partial [bacterium]
ETVVTVVARATASMAKAAAAVATEEMRAPPNQRKGSDRTWDTPFTWRGDISAPAGGAASPRP